MELRNRFIRETFGRYLTDEVVDAVLESPSGLQVGGEKRKITMLMADLRGFTSVSERLPPERVAAMLNRYLAAMVTVIKKYNGTIDDFVGDAIFALFGAPVWKEDDAERAVACAIGMQLAMGGDDHWTSSRTMARAAAHETSHPIPLCGIFSFDEEDRLAGEKIYYDRAAVLRQLGLFHEPSEADIAERQLDVRFCAKSGSVPDPPSLRLHL